MFGPKIEKLWLKLLISVLIFCGTLIIIGYLYYRNSSCGVNVWDCLEFEVIMLGGGILLFSLPLIGILFVWEVAKKIKEKKEERKEAALIRNDIPEVTPDSKKENFGSPFESSADIPEDINRFINNK